MDLIVSVCRVLASRPRLRLLRAVHAQPGMTVQILAAATALPVPETSKHLRRLVGFQLVQTTPQGRYVRYTPPRPQATSLPFLRQIQGLLQAMLTPPPANSTLGQVWNLTSLTDKKAEDESLLKLFTTYTHLRRLMILRHLRCYGSCSSEVLVTTLKMSAPAVHRHLHKLLRRGVATVTAHPPHLWQLARPTGTPCRQQLLDMVLRTLKTTPSLPPK